MNDNLLRVANLYATGLQDVLKRRDHWLEQYVALRDHLKEIATYLNTNALYKQGFYVDTLHAFNEDINGTSSKLPSVSFRSGEMPMLVTFRNSMGEKRSFQEEGFHISFNPTITGQVLVLLESHQSDLNKTPLPVNTLAIIDDTAELTTDVIDALIARGMEAAFYTSFTGMAAPTKRTGSEEEPLTPRNPIGFKRYETTEKIK